MSIVRRGEPYVCASVQFCRWLHEVLRVDYTQERLEPLMLGEEQRSFRSS
jgi:hypothetical protein